VNGDPRILTRRDVRLRRRPRILTFKDVEDRAACQDERAKLNEEKRVEALLQATHDEVELTPEQEARLYGDEYEAIATAVGLPVERVREALSQHLGR
jgi:hypothetical protein